MMCSRRRLPNLKIAGTLVVLALVGGGFVHAQALPPLPPLPLDSYEPAIRGPIEAAYEEARAHPGDPAREGVLGMVLYAHEQYEYAAPSFERAQAMDSGDGRWAYYLGRVRVYLGDHPGAVTALLQALEHRPNYLPAEVLVAQAALEAGAVDESFGFYEDLARVYPDVAEVHYGLGRIHAQRGEAEAAVEHLSRACKLYPSFGAAHFALARVYRDQGEEEKAREHLALYQKDKTGWPTLDDPLLADVVALRNSPTDHLRRGIHLAEQGQLPEAAVAHEAALEADPGLVQAHVNLIRIYGELGEAAKVEEHYRAAVEQEPGRADTHYDYGVFLVSAQRTDEAAEAFRRTLELAPDHADALNNYAYLLMTTGQLDEAKRYYRKAIESRPDLRSAHFNLGRILVNQEKIWEAIAHLRQTLTPEDEETPRCTYALAAALARAGVREEALKYMVEAEEKARARGQLELLEVIERDRRRLEQEGNS